MSPPFPPRPITLLLMLVLLATGCGGSGHSPDKSADVFVVQEQTFRLADLPEVSTSQIGSGQAASQQIDQAVHAAMKNYKLPGATIAVMKDNQLIYAKGYGYSNLAMRAPARPEDRFQLGSISKTFTATAIMLLAEDGKLSLDDTMTKYFSGLPDSWRTITIRQLLSHSSGVQGDPPDKWAVPEIMEHFDSFMSGSDAQRVAAIAAIPLHSAPGTKFEYSNMGYFVLGMLVSRVAGMDYFDFLQQRVFRPLGMTSPRKIDASNSTAGTAIGYVPDGDVMREITMNPNVYRLYALGCGGIEMNVLDMAKWDAALYGNQVLTAASVAEMARPQVKLGEASWWGLGWALYTVNGHFLMKHDGGMAGFVTTYRRWPDDRFSTVVLTNSGDATADISGALFISRAITDLLQPALSIH